MLLERWPAPGPEGWTAVGAAVARQDGPRWRHEVDGPAADLLAGCHGALPLGELVELLAFAHDRPTDALVAATLPAVREFVRHGLLVARGPPASVDLARSRAVGSRGCAEAVGPGRRRGRRGAIAAIPAGLLVLLGVHRDDTAAAAAA